MYVFVNQDGWLVGYSGMHKAYYRTHAQNYLDNKVLTFDDEVDANYHLKHYINPQLASTLTIKKLTWKLE